MFLHAGFMGLDENQIPIGSKTLSKGQEKLFQNFLEERRGWIFPTVSGWISFSFKIVYKEALNLSLTAAG